MTRRDAGATLANPIVDRLAKKAAPSLARAIPSRLSRAASIYLDILQGKGSGTGWDMAGEAGADATALGRVARPVIVDGGANFGQWAAFHRCRSR